MSIYDNIITEINLLRKIMATSQTKRVLELIKRFNDGEKVYIEALQNDINWWNVLGRKEFGRRAHSHLAT